MASVSDELSKFLKNEFSAQTSTIKEELAKLREEIKQIRSTTGERVQLCEERVNRVEEELLEFKRHSIKNNIIITGLELNDSNLVHSVISQLNSLLNINLVEFEVNNIYRLSKNNSVIKIEFLSFLAKSKVINNRRKLKGTRIYISEDLCQEDRSDFRFLRQQLSIARAKNYRAYIRSRFLYVNGEKYSIEQLKGEDNLDRSPKTSKDFIEEPATLSSKNLDLVNSAPGSPAPIARFKQMLTEHDHLQTEEQSKLNKEISTLNLVLNKTKDFEDLGRTRSQSSGSSGPIRRDQRAGNLGSKTKRGG